MYALLARGFNPSLQSYTGQTNPTVQRRLLSTGTKRLPTFNLCAVGTRTSRSSLTETADFAIEMEMMAPWLETSLKPLRGTLLREKLSCFLPEMSSHHHEHLRVQPVDRWAVRHILPAKRSHTCVRLHTSKWCSRRGAAFDFHVGKVQHAQQEKRSPSFAGRRRLSVPAYHAGRQT